MGNKECLWGEASGALANELGRAALGTLIVLENVFMSETSQNPILAKNP